MFLTFYRALNISFSSSFIYLYIYFMLTKFLKPTEQSFFFLQCKKGLFYTFKLNHFYSSTWLYKNYPYKQAIYIEIFQLTVYLDYSNLF